MTSDYATVLLWGLFMAVLGAVAVVFFDPSDPETPALLGGTALLMLLIGLFLATRRRGAPDAGDLAARVVPDSSVATVCVAVSIATLALGAELGLWLALAGAGMLAVGLGGLVREARASRGQAERALGVSRPRRSQATVAGEGAGSATDFPGED